VPLHQRAAIWATRRAFYLRQTSLSASDIVLAQRYFNGQSCFDGLP